MTSYNHRHAQSLGNSYMMTVEVNVQPRTQGAPPVTIGVLEYRSIDAASLLVGFATCVEHVRNTGFAFSRVQTQSGRTLDG